MIQKAFAENVTEILKNDQSVIGLAVAGSWLTNEIDEFSDLDLIVITHEKISHDQSKMLAYAKRFGSLISAFTGEHVGEPRLLICLFENPLLHVDIKFLTLDEFESRVETPSLLIDHSHQLQKILDRTAPRFPLPDYQWIEDRFYTWIHYALLKIGRGEYLEAYDFFGFLRMVVFGPLLHIKSGNLPRGVRKAETQLDIDDFNLLKSTIADYNRESLLIAVGNAIDCYKILQTSLFDSSIKLNKEAEKAVTAYFHKIKKE